MNSESPIKGMELLGFPWRTLDPFLFCVHHLDAYPPGNNRLGPQASLAGRRIGMDFEVKDGWRMYHGREVPGFPQHPHRGFETVTIVRQGLIDHSDSLGATARFGGGDIQWLTTGRGIVHCEMFPLVDSARPNPVELFQIWLNLPPENKFANPYFSMYWSEDIRSVTFEDTDHKATRVTVYAGSLDAIPGVVAPPESWAARDTSDVAIWTIRLDPGARWMLPPTDSATNRMLYFFSGEGLEVAGTRVPPSSALELRAEQPTLLAAADTPCELVLLQGRPIGEPVAQYGPFVMNTPEEIQQAIADYRRDGFGGWPWPSDEPVHAQDQARFAKHPDGRVESPPLR